MRASRADSRAVAVARLCVAAAAASALGCGGGAGAPCGSRDDCASGLACRGGVCLPFFEPADAGADGDAAPDERDDAGPSEVGDDGAGDESADGTDSTDDSGADGEDAPAPTLVSLEPGEASDVADTGVPSGVFGGAGEEYVLIMWENSLAMFATRTVAVEVENGRKATGIRAKLGRPSGPGLTPCLPMRFSDAGARRLPEPGPRVLADPVPGDTATFRVINASGTSVEEITCRLEAIGASVEIWYDVTNAFTDPGADFRAGVIRWFDEVTLPRERFLFHDEPDVDGNGRVIVLVSPTVGRIGAAGYVNPYDVTDSPYGNHKDIIYLNPPGDWYGATLKILSASAVVAHELQHLIRAGALGPDVGEALYMNEGMSHLAADLAGFGFDNLWFLRQFLDEPSSWTLPLGIDSPRSSGTDDGALDVVLRAGSYFLLRYLVDRLGGIGMDDGGTLLDEGGLSFLRGQYAGELLGAEFIESSAGIPQRDFLPDWLTAMVLDGRTDAAGAPLATPSRYRLADPTTDVVTGAQRGVALNADNAYLDLGVVHLDDAATTDLRDFDGLVRGGGFVLLEVRPVYDGPVVARITVSPGVDIGARWVRRR